MVVVYETRDMPSVFPGMPRQATSHTSSTQSLDMEENPFIIATTD